MSKLNVVAIAAGLLFSSGTMAGQHMSKDVYKSEKDRIFPPVNHF